MSRAHTLIVAIAMTVPFIPTSGQNRPPEDTGPVAAPPALHDGRHDFDFLHGTWRIHNRRLRHPLTGSSEWYEFEGRSVERPLWGGLANIEEYHATLPDGGPLRGLALRLYEPGTRRWTIHWSNAMNGTLDPPMTGAFRSGVGEFFSHEDYQGRMILVRFRWTRRGPDAARWEQAFSADGGRSWEVNWIMDFTRTGPVLADLSPPDIPRCCPVVELRQYTLHPGQREALIELFEREFIETQEATGMTVVAQFRDLDRPHVFTWIRGFPDMTSRATALGAFYGGPVWARHREAANATMVNSDNVRLLRPVGSGFPLGQRPAIDDGPGPSGLIVASICTLAPARAGAFAGFFASAVVPLLSAHGASPIAVFETEPSVNTYPRLPVREGERSFVWFAQFGTAADYDRHVDALARDPRWTTDVRPRLERMLVGPVETWRLTPTSRSRVFR